MQWLFFSAVFVTAVLAVAQLWTRTRERQEAPGVAVPEQQARIMHSAIAGAIGPRDQLMEAPVQAVPHNMMQAAAAFLREWLNAEEIAEIRRLVRKHGTGDWIWHLHDESIEDLYPLERHYAIHLAPQFGFGMQVRNALRRAGFGERELGVRNLQEVYVGLLEAAAEDECPPARGCAASQGRPGTQC